MKFLLATVAGSDVADKARNLMSRIVSDELMSMLNYCGRGKKTERGSVDHKLVTSLIFGRC